MKRNPIDWEIGNSRIVNRACQAALERRGLITKREQAMRDLMDRGREAQARARRERKERQ